MFQQQKACEKITAVEDPAEEHKDDWTKKALGGAFAFAWLAEWNKKKEEERNSQEHAPAKELLAVTAGGVVEDLIETKDMDENDRKKAKEEAEKLYAQETGQEL